MRVAYVVAVASVSCVCWAQPASQGQVDALDRAFAAYGSAAEDDKFIMEGNVRELGPSSSYLESKLRTGKPYERVLAARLLSLFGDKGSLAVLKESLVGAAVPELIVEVVETTRDLDVQAGLIRAKKYLSHEDGLVRQVAVYVVAREARKEDWLAISKLYGDVNPQVRREIVTYGNPPPKDDMEDPGFARFLYEQSHDEDEGVRSALCYRLSKEKNIAALRILNTIALEDNSKKVRALALGLIDSWYRKHYDRKRTPPLWGGGTSLAA